MELTQELLEERLNSLPEDIRRAVTDDAVLRDIQELGNKYTLRLDKIGILTNEVALVMLGLKKTSDFIRSLSKELEIDRETAESLAIDVDNEVFRKVRESLRTVQFGDDTSPAAAAPLADPEHGDSPARDSLLKEVEMHGNDGVAVGATEFTSSSDYSADAFGQEQPVQTAYTPAPTPYEQTAISDEERLDPTKTFKDHLEKKMESVKTQVNADPYKESIE